MKKRMLRVMSAAFLNWLRREIEPAGKACLHELEAKSSLLVDALPEGEESPLNALDEQSVRDGLNWLLTSLRVAYPSEWAPLACESLRLLLHRNIVEITLLARPPEGGQSK